jgi:hypothetical protein
MIVHKYPFHAIGFQEVYLPIGYEILHVGLDPQNNYSIWALVNPINQKIPVPIGLFYTGEKLPKDIAKYLGTFVEGSLVYHVFQLAP